MSTTNPDGANKRDGHHVATGTPRPLSDSFRSSHESASTTNPTLRDAVADVFVDYGRALLASKSYPGKRGSNWATVPTAYEYADKALELIEKQLAVRREHWDAEVYAAVERLGQ